MDRWTDPAGFLVQGVGPGKWPVPRASRPHTHRAAGGTLLAARQLPGMPVGDSWSPARCCHTSQGPSAFSAFVSDDWGAGGWGGGHGTAQNPAAGCQAPGGVGGAGEGELSEGGRAEAPPLPGR